MNQVNLSLLATCSVLAMSSVHAADFGKEKIAQWGDPFTPIQTRTRCVSDAWGKWPWGGEWRTCNGWATDTRSMQVEVFVKTLGPDNLSQAAIDAVQAVAKTCGTIAGGSAAAAFAGAPSPEVAARIAAAYAAATTTFSGCIGAEASKLTAVGVTTAALNLAFETSSYWSQWSNESSGTPTPPPPPPQPVYRKPIIDTGAYKGRDGKTYIAN